MLKLYSSSPNNAKPNVGCSLFFYHSIFVFISAFQNIPVSKLLITKSNILIADSSVESLPFKILSFEIVVLTQPGCSDATVCFPKSLFDKIFEYIFNAVFDIRYATESVKLHNSIEPIFDETLIIFPPILMCLHINSVKNKVPVTFTSNVCL